MVKTIMVRFRASRQEFEKIQSVVSARGFPTVSAFLRSFALDRDLWLEKKIQEINTLVHEIHQILKAKR